VVGRLVRMAEERECGLKDLPVNDLKKAHAFLTEDVLKNKPGF